jgi:hypothetical protein
MNRVIVASVILLGLVACADNILKERPVRSLSSRGSGVSLATAANSHATVCGAYRRQLQQVKVAQSIRTLGSTKEALHAKELSLNAVIADVCE